MKDKKEAIEESKDKPKKTCGIIIPISIHPDYPSGHWMDVLNIIKQAIEETDFEPKLVSEDEVVGLIHERIVTNIYNNEIVVCDVSSKNPNVMFELGLRLAFDKPTIIIKDDKTSYSFDTGVIEHITYPSSLRFSQIVKFKDDLKRRINATYEKSKEPGFSPFLKNFGRTMKSANLNETQIPAFEFLVEKIEGISKEIQLLRSDQKNIEVFNSKYMPIANAGSVAKEFFPSKKRATPILPNEFYSKIGSSTINPFQAFEDIFNDPKDDNGKDDLLETK